MLVNWQPIALGELIEIVRGQAPPGNKCNKDGRGTIFVKAGEFAAQRPVVREWTAQPLKFAKRGDVLICVVGATLGKINLGIDCAIGRSVAALRPTAALDQKYLYYFLVTKVLSLRGDSVGSAQGVISKDDLSQIEIPAVPINEQHRIVAKIEELFSELDKGIENLKTAQVQLKVYRQALLKHAFEGKLTAQWRAQRRAKQTVAPAQAGAQPLNDMNSHPTPLRGQALRGNDEAESGNDKSLETAEALLKRIQKEREQRYEQQLAEWEKSLSIPLLQRGKPTSTAPILPLEKGGRGGISKPKPPKSLPPLTAEELAELPELPEGWGWVRLEEITEHITDGDHQAPPQTKEGIPFITISDIKNQKIDFSDTRHVSRTYYEGLSVMKKPVKDDILYTVTGSFGISCLIDSNREFCFQRHIGLIRSCKDIDKKFLFYLLSSRQIHNQAASVATGTAQKTVPLGGLRLFKIPIMSHQEQKQIAIELDTRISEADQLDQTITTSLQQAEALRQSILKKAFSGQLVPQDPNDEPASELLARIRAEKAAPSNVKGNQRSVRKEAL